MSSVLILILVFAAALAAALDKRIAAIAIAAIVVLFVVPGVVQEHRAQRAIAALEQMSSPQVRVLRDGAIRDIPSRERVPGDIVLLEACNVVPANARGGAESITLRVQGTARTGERTPGPAQAREHQRVAAPVGVAAPGRHPRQILDVPRAGAGAISRSSAGGSKWRAHGSSLNSRRLAIGLLPCPGPATCVRGPRRP